MAGQDEQRDEDQVDVHTHHGEQPAAHWWHNNKTGEVEHGPQSLGSDRDGPYSTEADARRAPEIARERARAWAADDEE